MARKIKPLIMYGDFRDKFLKEHRDRHIERIKKKMMVMVPPEAMIESKHYDLMQNKINEVIEALNDPKRVWNIKGEIKWKE